MCFFLSLVDDDLVVSSSAGLHFKFLNIFPGTDDIRLEEEQLQSFDLQLAYADLIL